MGNVNIFDGIEPVKAFLDISICEQSLHTNDENKLIFPCNSLDRTDNILRCAKFDKVEGKVPSKWLDERVKLTIDVKSPTVDGIVPLKSFLSIDSALKRTNEPMQEGIVPVILLYDK